jgi:hypothetical protein
MGHPDGAHTHGHGGGGHEGIVMIVLAVIAAALLLPTAAAGAVTLLHALAVIAITLAALAAVTGGAVVWWRLRHKATRPQLAARERQRAIPASRAPWQAVQREQQQAIGPAAEVHVHHHWHGATAEDVAELLDRRRQP